MHRTGGDRARRAGQCAGTSACRRRGRFLTQRLAFTHRRVRRLRGLLQKRSARWAERAFVAEGAELVRGALAAGAPVESVYVSPAGDDDRATQDVVRRAATAGARVFPLGAGVLERVADTVTPQPILAVLPMLEEPPPGAPEWEARPGALVVVLVDVRDPGNAGTVLRAADASGVQAVVFAGDSVDPYNPKTVRSSAGSIFHVPVAVWASAGEVATALRDADGFRTLATVVRDGDDYAGLDWSVPSALFLGNESAGLDPALVATLDAAIVIPMTGLAESLNVGVASAVVSFEAFRQRRGGGRGAPNMQG
ncbi:MAG TPA: RNA methyltransferase [Acidimicrobiales bacterium]|nr:RNA methyltransferase [Acidimicrobiales bacterium]